MDSHELYLVAALDGWQRIPYGDLADPYVFGFVLEYCKAALEVVTGAANASRDRAAEILACVGDSTRFLAIVGDGAEERCSVTQQPRCDLGVSGHARSLRRNR